MNEKCNKVITYTGMVLAAIAGSIFGLVLIIAGYLLDWGPGGSTEGPFWRIMLVGIPSFLIGASVGITAVWWLLKKLLINQQSSVFEIMLKSLLVIFISSTAAFVSSWAIGYFIGKITHAIQGLDWIVVLVYTPLMALVYSLPVSLITTFLFSIFLFFYLKDFKEKPQLK